MLCPWLMGRHVVPRYKEQPFIRSVVNAVLVSIGKEWRMEYFLFLTGI